MKGQGDARRDAHHHEGKTQMEKTAAIETAVAEATAEHNTRKGSVVALGYKQKYAARAAARERKVPGVSAKALKRSSQDWLALLLAKATLVEKDKIDIAKFEEILDENGVAHSHWNRTTAGWQGRLRMTGRLALNRVIVETGFVTIGGQEIPAPRSWIAAHER